MSAKFRNLWRGWCKTRLSHELQHEKAHREFDPNPDFFLDLQQLNLDVDDGSQEENELQCEDTTTPKELEDFVNRQKTEYDGGKIRLEEKKKLNERIN